MKRKTTPHLAALRAAMALVFLTMLAYGDPPSLSQRIRRAQTNGSVTNLAVIAQEVESLWPGDPAGYFIYQKPLGGAFESLCASNATARRLLERQTEWLLTKKCPDHVLVIERCLSVKSTAMERLANVRNSKPTLRMARLMAIALGEAHSAVIPDYQPAWATANVSPPVMPTNFPPAKDGVSIIIVVEGMSIDAITDPVAKEAYRKAIHENSLKSAQNQLQQNLPYIILHMKIGFGSYCHALFQKDAEAKKQLENLAELARLTEEEVKRLKQHFRSP